MTVLKFNTLFIYFFHSLRKKLFLWARSDGEPEGLIILKAVNKNVRRNVQFLRAPVLFVATGFIF